MRVGTEACNWSVSAGVNPAINRETEQTELYNLTLDPYQLDSLPAEGLPVTTPLRSRLARLRDCTGIEGRDPAPADGLSYCE